MFPKNFAFCLWSPSFFFDYSLSLLAPLRASSSTDKIGPRQRPRRAAKLRVGKEKERRRGMNSSPKAWPSLQICVAARSVSWRFPGSSCKLRYSLCNLPPTPVANPLPCLSAPTLLEITEAHRWCASQQAMLGGRCFSFANEGMAKSGSCQRKQGDWIRCV